MIYSEATSVKKKRNIKPKGSNLKENQIGKLERMLSWRK